MVQEVECRLPRLTEIIIKVSNPSKGFLTWFPNTGPLTKALVAVVGILAQTSLQERPGVGSAVSRWLPAAAPSGPITVFKSGYSLPRELPANDPACWSPRPGHLG